MELPLTHPEYYEEMGIKPPKGVILYGAPGTGESNTPLFVCLFHSSKIIELPKHILMMIYRQK